jgi:isopentenyldiphosphate isomerase
MADELLDVFDERGWHRGAKLRSEVHRDGDWHLAFHLWVVRGDGVLLQRRATLKRAWPGRLDATAAGHLLAGEAVRDGLREAEEELGVAYAFGDLVELGVHRVEDADGEGVVNRELQHVFAMRDERQLEAWTDFDRGEVDGLVLIGHEDFARLVAAQDGVVVRGRAWDGEAEHGIDVRPRDLVPTPYLAAIAGPLAEVAAGRTP